MAIVPQRRTSKTRKRQRRSHQALTTPGIMVCPNCGEVKLAHVVCPSCGFYDGKKVINIKVSGEESVVEEKVKTDKTSKKKVAKAPKKAAIDEKAPKKAKSVDKKAPTTKQKSPK
jgi:large subunit ribosomal protein L32